MSPTSTIPSPATASPPLEPPEANDTDSVDGLDESGAPWGDYPIDSLLIRHEHRTIHEVVRRIDRGTYILNPDFQRAFLWDVPKQSKLIESVLMRIPLPVLYLAENADGKVVVVDGLQRLATFQRFLDGHLQLALPDRSDLNGKRFADLPEKLQNRVEDCNLTLYSIDASVPERARLDIFERVNNGVPLTRQQMRNCLYMGQATQFLAEQATTDLFQQATGRSLKPKTMRDREFVNRFCAFHLLPLKNYDGDMDRFLAAALVQMNNAPEEELTDLRNALHQGLTNNLLAFGKHAFRKHQPGQEGRSVLNASLWDVMVTGLVPYDGDHVRGQLESFKAVFFELLCDDKFNEAITYGPNDARKVRRRFKMAQRLFQETLGATPD